MCRTTSSSFGREAQGAEAPVRAQRPAPRASDSGFTLAGVIVIMTIISVFVAYTVPKQWSIAIATARVTMPRPAYASSIQ